MTQPDDTSQDSSGASIYPALARAGAYSWWLIGIGIVGLAVLWLLAQLWVLVLAAAVAAFLSRALDMPARYLRAKGLPRALVAAGVLVGFILVLAGIVALLVPSIAGEFDDLGPTIEDAIDDVENWLVEDSPFDVSRQDVQDFRDQADERVGDLLASQSGTLISGTVLVFEVIAGIVLALVTTFFILKDGDRFGDWFVTRFPHHRRDLAGRVGARAWRTLGGYLRGSATLGLIEGIIIGTTVWLVGGSLAIPVAVITFFAAFVPFAGALIAGVIAILVTLVTAGFGGAVVVAIVAAAGAAAGQRLPCPLGVREEPRAPPPGRAGRHHGRRDPVRRLRRVPRRAGERRADQRPRRVAGGPRGAGGGRPGR